MTLAAVMVRPNDRVYSCAIATGTIISALTSSSPTTRIAMVTVRAAIVATSMDRTRTGRPEARGDHRTRYGERVLRHEAGPTADEPAERDTGQGDVADAVAHQGHASLHEEGADDGSRRAHQHGRDHGTLHERGGHQLDHLV